MENATLQKLIIGILLIVGASVVLGFLLPTIIIVVKIAIKILVLLALVAGGIWLWRKFSE